MSKDDKKRYLILKDPNIIKGLAILSLPLMLNNLARTLHDLVDMFFLGKLGDEGISAMASIQITFPITFMYISLGMGLSVAGTALISQLYGSSQFEMTKKYGTQLVTISVLLGLVLNVFAYFLAEPIMSLMGAEDYLLENAALYLRIRSFELPFLFIFFAFTSIRQASGDTVTPVILGISTIIINIILTPILVLHYDMGVAGAAYATLFATIVVMPFGIRLLFRSKGGITINLKYSKLEAGISKEIITTAIPASLGQAITAIGFGVLNGFILSYGEATVTAFAVGNRISSIFLHPVMAIGGVMSAYIGQNIGNLNPDRSRKAFREGLVLSIVLMTIGSVIGLLFRRSLTGLFIDPTVHGWYPYNLAITYMFFLFIGLPLMAVFQSFIGAYNGTGKTMYTLILGITRLWFIRIPLIIAFGAFTTLGNSGIWYAMLISNVIIVFVGMTFMKYIDFKPKINIEPTLS